MFLRCLIASSLFWFGCGNRLIHSQAEPEKKREVGKIIPCENVETVFGWVTVCFSEGDYSCRPDTTMDLSE